MRNAVIIAGAAVAFLTSVSLAAAKSDSGFLTDAIQGNLGEISIGELAQKNGGSEGVKSCSWRIIRPPMRRP
jgi:hypothetical protein